MLSFSESRFWFLESKDIYAKNSIIPYKVQLSNKENKPIGNPERIEDAFQKNDISVANIKGVVDGLKKYGKAVTYDNKGSMIRIAYL